MDEIQATSRAEPVQIDLAGRPRERDPEATGGKRASDPFIIPGVVLVAGLVLALGLGFVVRSPEPRELSFPRFDPRAPFPELIRASRGGHETTTPPLSRFDAALQRGTAPDGEPAAEPPERRAVPIGGDLIGEIPLDPRSWRWSSERGATLVLHQPPDGRPDALLYAEAFTGEIGERPTAELHRFRVTVDPEGDGDSLLLESLSWATGRPTQAAQILASRTLGRGIGFTAGEEGFTGWRWVGRNQHGVAIRLARWLGTWHEQRPLPAQLARDVRDAVPELSSAPPPARLTRVPAYFLIGSAAEPGESSGAHLAILCARTPDCPVADELAALLDSIRTEPPSLLERLLREGLQEPFRELAASAGIEVQQASDDASPATEPEPVAPSS